MSTDVHNPDAVIEKQDDQGYCGLVIDARNKGNEIICGEAGAEEVLVRNVFGLYAVMLCAVHRAQHRNFYDRLRAKKNRQLQR